jgi:hypothetical protein
MLFYRLLQQSVNTDPHPLADLIGGTTIPNLIEHDDVDPLHDNIFEDL